MNSFYNGFEKKAGLTKIAGVTISIVGHPHGVNDVYSMDSKELRTHIANGDKEAAWHLNNIYDHSEHKKLVDVLNHHADEDGSDSAAMIRYYEKNPKAHMAKEMIEYYKNKKPAGMMSHKDLAFVADDFKKSVDKHFDKSYRTNFESRYGKMHDDEVDLDKASLYDFASKMKVMSQDKKYKGFHVHWG